MAHVRYIQREWDEEAPSRYQKHLQRYEQLEPRIPSSVGEGWRPLVGEAALVLDLIAPGWTCDQVKEKFGTLSFYVTAPVASSDELFYAVHAVASKAEAISSGICEFCGAYGQMREGGWLKTLCDEHAEKYAAGWRPWIEEWEQDAARAREKLMEQDA